MRALSYKGENLYNEKDFPVMMAWEKPYMEYCINMLHPVGDVLEIGFGSGYSAQQIQKFPIRSHTIVECDPNVLKKLYSWAEKQKHPVNIIFGTWQDRLKLLGRFDTIFFDDCFLTDHPYEYNMAGLKYFIETIHRQHKKLFTKLGWYCETPPTKELVIFFKEINASYKLYEFKIKKPTDVNYAQQHKDVMFVPQLSLES